MTDNLKNFLSKVSQDPELARKMSKLNKEDLIAAAKEQGFALTEADLDNSEGAMSEDELSGVSGGGACYCAVGGGGTKDENDKHACGCVLMGIGDDNDRPNNQRCFCGGAGYGYSTAD